MTGREIALTGTEDHIEDTEIGLIQMIEVMIEVGQLFYQREEVIIRRQPALREQHVDSIHVKVCDNVHFLFNLSFTMSLLMGILFGIRLATDTFVRIYL